MSAALQSPHIGESNLARESAFARVIRPRLYLPISFLPVILTLVIWRLSLLHVNVSNLNDYGLPPALPITWYLALTLGGIGAVAAITTRRTSGVIMIAYVVVVAIILFGTVPVLSAQPHYAWVYKHIGVVRYLEAHGKVNPTIDIYNRWPGFFALGAAFSLVAGHPNPETYASWAEVFFLLLDVILVMAAVKVITRDIRIAAGAGLFLVVTDWVGQTYYSPQAFAFVLGLAVILIMLRHLRVATTQYSMRLSRLVERVGRVSQLPVETVDVAKWPRWAVLTTIMALDAVTVASHQLTPYMLLVSVALLMLAGVLRPWWLLIAMGTITFAYLGANLHFIEHNYGLFTSIDPFNNAQGPKLAVHPQTPSSGKLFNVKAELLLIAATWLGTLCAVVRLLRRGLLTRALPFLVLAVSPFFVLFGQNYGGEASLRILLFSSPWCAALISWALATVTRLRLRAVIMAFTTIVFTTFFVPSFLGQEELNIIPAAEVRASEWFYDHASHGSVLLLAAPGFPYRYGPTYPAFRGPEGDANPNLLTEPVFQGQQLGAADVSHIVARIKEYAQHGYIVFSKDEITFAEVFRITPPRALSHLETAVARSPDFRLWYANRDARIYELVELGGASKRSVKSGQPGLHAPALHVFSGVSQLGVLGDTP